MDDADDVVEILAIDRHARMAEFAHGLQQAFQIDCLRQGVDIGARHHHVIGGEVAELEDIQKERRFIGIERRLAIVAGFGFLDQFLDRVAQGVVTAALAAEHLEETLETQARLAVFLCRAASRRYVAHHSSRL